LNERDISADIGFAIAVVAEIVRLDEERSGRFFDRGEYTGDVEVTGRGANGFTIVFSHGWTPGKGMALPRADDSRGMGNWGRSLGRAVHYGKMNFRGFN
jgi:hypothetical protein